MFVLDHIGNKQAATLHFMSASRISPLDRILNLKHEVDRGAVKLEPIRLNTDEFYHVLRKRLFEQLPDECETMDIVRGYVQALRDAKQMELIHLSPDQLVGQLKEAYPFHFAIRDLYARFRENPGFQQTRGLLRLMRAVVARLFDEQTGKADQQFLIHAHDLDLNDLDTLEEVARINDKFSNAISHDIAAGGNTVAERIDTERGGSDAQDVCKLLLVSSLANIPNPLLGLSRPEIIAFLCAPTRDITSLASETIEALLSQAWYLYENPVEEKYYFRDIKNLVAMVNSLTEGYSRDASVLELKKFLEWIFIPSKKDCYQEVLAFPALDDITIVQDKVTLVIYEPHISGLHPDLKKFYNDLTYRNRILFLSGTQTNLEHAIHLAGRLKAINSILTDMKVGSRPDLASQHTAANQLHERVLFGLLSTIREIFTTLTYPYGDRLINAYFPMQFTDSTYNGEQQIRDTLKDAQKFTEEISGDMFCKKCEARLFTRGEMYWSEIKRRAAENTQWPWHRLNALDLLKEEQIRKGHWREHGSYVEKPPFPPSETEVRVQQIHRNEETGKAKLKLTSMHGDTIYWATGSEVGTHSQVVPDPQNFETDEVALSFLCIDSSGQHQTGKPASWTNRLAIKYLVSSYGNIKRVELRAVPTASIYYTIDGSDPKNHGRAYIEPFSVSPPTSQILAVAQKDGVRSTLEHIEIFWDAERKVHIDDTTPATWKRPFDLQSTQEVYDFLQSLKKYHVSVLHPRIVISGKHWLELTCDEELLLQAEKLEEAIEHMRGLPLENSLTITLSVDTLQFPTGLSLRGLAAEVKSDVLPGEVIQ